MPLLLSRADKPVPGAGTTSPTDIPNNAVFALFGLIGVAFIVVGIWFFFWARNGGFHFREGDWEDYKSTVLRRKGPNGTTLSGGTRTTDLGGGSIVGKKYRDSESTLGTESTVASSEMTDLQSLSVSQRGDRREKHRKERSKSKSKSKPKSKAASRKERIPDEEMANPLPEEAIRMYRHEKAARVGGLNRSPDGEVFDGSQDAASELLSNREKTPTSTPTKKRERRDTYTGGSGGVRKVNTVSGNANSYVSSNVSSERSKAITERSNASTERSNASTERSAAESARIKAEAKKLQDKGRAAGSSRRDFSYTPGDDQVRVPGSWAGSEVESNGTKSYHHPIPGLSEYAEERRKARAGGKGGYRREA